MKSANYIIVGVLVCLLFSACCRPRISSEKTDSVRIITQTEYREILRDTTIYVEIPVESHSAIVRDSSFLETKFATSKARINEDGTLYHDLWNKPQFIPVPVQVKDTETVRDSHEQTARIETETVTIEVEKRLNWLQRFLIYSGVFLWGFLIFRYLPKIIKFRF